MQQENFNKQVRLLSSGLSLFFTALVIMGGFLLIYTLYPNSSLFKLTTSTEVVTDLKIADSTVVENEAQIANGIHLSTGFVVGKGMEAVIRNCTSCHSAKLVTQNRMSREAWLVTIRWMQDSENLWDLGEDETAILDYLSTYYAPKSQGRRQKVSVEQWYELPQ